MADLWHYRHAGKDYGPVTVEKLEQLATIGALLASDPVWREGEDARRSVEAISIVGVDYFGKVLAEVDEGLTAQPPPVNRAPDWLSDVASEPAPTPKPKHAKPTPISLAKPKTNANAAQVEPEEEEEEEERRGFEFTRRELIMFCAGIGVVTIGLGFAFLLAKLLFGSKTDPPPGPSDNKDKDESKPIENPPPADPN